MVPKRLDMISGLFWFGLSLGSGLFPFEAKKHEAAWSEFQVAYSIWPIADAESRDFLLSSWFWMLAVFRLRGWAGNLSPF